MVTRHWLFKYMSSSDVNRDSDNAVVDVVTVVVVVVAFVHLISVSGVSS